MTQAAGSAHDAHHAVHHDVHHDDHDDHDDALAGYHASVKGYAVGFGLSVLLTALPFWLVMAKVLPTPGLTAAVILALGAVQIVVHMVYFLHMNSQIEEGWSLLSLVFTGLLVAIMLAGSIWVMYHLNTNMMPVHDVRNLP